MPADNFDYSRPGGENVELLQALIDGATEYTKDTNSRNAAILKSIINNTEYTEPPQSEIEELLLELKAVIGGQIEVNELIADENGTYDAGLNKAFNPVTVAVPLGHKTITANGVYSASTDDLAGYDEVTVDVEGYQIKSLPNTPTSIATITDGTALPMPSLKVGIEAVQSGSGDPSPTNIRPFTGWSAVNRYRTGINAWDEEWENGRINANTGEYTSGNGLRCKNKISVRPSTAYFMTSGVYGDSSGCLFVYYDSDENYISYDNKYSANNTFYFTTPSNARYMCFNRQTSTAVTTYNNDISINYPSTDTDYHAFSGTTYTTTLKDSQGNPLTCYGGELSNENGVQTLLNIDDAVDMGDLAWNYSGGMFSSASLTSVIKRPASNSEVINGSCEIFKVNSYNGLADMQFAVSTAGNLFVKCSDYTDSTSFKTAVTGYKLKYPFATPQTIPQDNLAIASQDGINNLWADSGEILEGEYFAEL